MLWLHLIYTLLMYSKMCAATFSMNSFMKIANLEFTQIPIHLFCGISVINCASKCDTDVGCLAFNYNRGTRTCRLMSFNPFDMTVWPDLAYSDEWDTYTNQEPSGQMIPTDCSTANQSTTGIPGESDADRACDGVTETNYAVPPHCAHTHQTIDNWWQVELLVAGPVAAVDMYFRSDCCAGRDRDLSIYVCGTQAECDAYAEAAFCAYFVGPTVWPAPPQRVNCNNIRYGRFLRIRQTAPPPGNWLVLCEVLVIS